jgi:antitoxin (DNA-binding transcriptional repressor) of toxin-antitoxin stability system
LSRPECARIPEYAAILVNPCFLQSDALMAIIAMRDGEAMRTVNIAKLKDQLSKYLTFAKSGEEVVIRDRNLPVAKLVPFLAEGADAQELRLVAAGKLRLPTVPLDVQEILNVPTGTVKGNKVIQSVTAEREEGR